VSDTPDTYCVPKYVPTIAISRRFGDYIYRSRQKAVFYEPESLATQFKPEPPLKIVLTLLNITALSGLLLTGVAIAHHSVPVNFDSDSSHTVTGKLIKTIWANPHSQMQVEVATEGGGTEIWLIEMNAIETIRRLGKKMGFTADDFVIGETITVRGWPGRHHQAVYFRTATLASGQEIIWQNRLNPLLAKIQQD